MGGFVEQVTDADFDREVLEAGVPVLVDFWAPWCGPCLMVGPVVESIAAERGESLRVVKVNVDDAHGVARQMGIRSIPTLMLFSGGEMREMVVGARPKAELDAMIDRVARAPVSHEPVRV